VKIAIKKGKTLKVFSASFSLLLLDPVWKKSGSRINILHPAYLKKRGSSGEGGLLSLSLLVTGHVLHSSHVKDDGSNL
jgi:hypothetical protein